ncbi:unnamed protein product [Camellia sinensis]
MKFLPEPIDIRASSNGLICCQGQTGDKPYYICNPVTRQLKKLPKTNADHGLDPAVVLVFEPSLLNFVADYKLVCAFPSVDFDNATEFEIYSSTDGSWKISGETCFASKKLVPRSGIYVDGVVYWQAKHHGIVAFDLTKDRSQLIQIGGLNFSFVCHTIHTQLYDSFFFLFSTHTAQHSLSSLCIHCPNFFYKIYGALLVPHFRYCIYIFYNIFFVIQIYFYYFFLYFSFTLFLIFF